MNEPSKPSHVIELRVPALSGQGKAVLAVLALGVAVFTGWAIGHHTSASEATVNRGYAPAPIVAAAAAEQPTPAPVALPQVQTPSSYTPPRPAVIENPPATVTEVVPPAQPVATTPPPAPAPRPALTAQQRLQDAIENQAATTGQTPAEVIQQLNPSAAPAPSSTVVTTPPPAPQTVVIQSPPAVYPAYYSYPYYAYPYGGYGYGYPYVGVGLNFNFGHGHFGGWHR